MSASAEALTDQVVRWSSQDAGSQGRSVSQNVAASSLLLFTRRHREVGFFSTFPLRLRVVYHSLPRGEFLSAEVAGRPGRV